LGIGSTNLTSYNLRISKTLTGSATNGSVFTDSVIQSDVTTNALGYQTNLSTLAAAFNCSGISHFSAGQSTIGAGSSLTNNYGFIATSSLSGATNNYGFYGQIAAPTSGILTTGTISTISSATTTVTINHNAITYTNGQIVTILATANATALTSGATCTILTVGSTDFTLIGAASNTVGVSFTATGAGTGSGTVRLNIQGSNKTVAGAALSSFTYTTTTSQTFAAITVLTGTVTVSLRYNLYMVGTAPNYLAGGLNVGATTDPGAGNISLTGNLAVGVTSPAVKLDVLGTVQAAAAATQDAVRLAGRAGGTGTFAVTLTPTTLTASRTLTLPDATTTVVGTDATQTLTNKRIDPRVVSAASASTLTPTIATADIYAYTALAAGLTINAPTGTPVDGNKLMFRLLDNGTARALTWNATYTVIGVTLPTTTVANKTTYVGCIYNANNTRWDVIAVATQA